MARPSKTQQFAIYNDNPHIPPTPPPDSSHGHSPDNNRTTPETYFNITEIEDHQDVTTLLDGTGEELEISNIQPTDTELDDDYRRQSAISSLPESSTETDQELLPPMHLPYESPMSRPAYRSPEQYRPMFGRSSQKSILHIRSRKGTPRSMKSSLKGSPLSRRRYEEEVQQMAEEERRDYPLVLLHITLLPVELRWSASSMERVLPSHTLDNLNLLRSKVSDTILQRGILIAHPKEEYELLEERLLDALELEQERLTKCGHFRARNSTCSTSTTGESAMSGDSDSGVGSSVGFDSEHCLTCQSPIKATGTGVGAGKNKWSVKVFAANGLMRASAWVAAWSEMERVDVEILPWISEDLRKQLDARRAEEEAEARFLAEESRLKMATKTRTSLTSARGCMILEQEDHGGILDLDRTEVPLFPTDESLPFAGGDNKIDLSEVDLPQVYRAKDVPLSLLLKNYLFLLAQDKRNLVIFGLAALILWMSCRKALSPKVDISALPLLPENLDTFPSTSWKSGVETPPSMVTSSFSDALPSQNVDIAQDTTFADDAVKTALVKDHTKPPTNSLRESSYTVMRSQSSDYVLSTTRTIEDSTDTTAFPILSTSTGRGLPSSAQNAKSKSAPEISSPLPTELLEIVRTPREAICPNPASAFVLFGCEICFPES